MQAEKDFAGVSVTFFAAACKALKEIHGDRTAEHLDGLLDL